MSLQAGTSQPTNQPASQPSNPNLEREEKKKKKKKKKKNPKLLHQKNKIIRTTDLLHIALPPIIPTLNTLRPPPARDQERPFEVLELGPQVAHRALEQVQYFFLSRAQARHEALVRDLDVVRVAAAADPAPQLRTLRQQLLPQVAEHDGDLGGRFAHRGDEVAVDTCARVVKKGEGERGV
jgi:hypothetical protein